MTENVCIETLQYLLGYENAVDKGEIDTPNNINSQEKEALRMILEEVQAYRAIGTVEDYWKLNEMCKEYSAIGTIDEFKALKDKATPKKDNNDGGRCKYCGTYNNFIINKLANPKGHPVIHCWNCGQALDWQ